MKKLFIFAVFLVVVGVLCAVFFLRGGKDENNTDEKPWTVGEQTAEVETTEETTESFDDAVAAFSDYVHTDLREDYAFLSTEAQEPYAVSGLSDSLLSVYVYDVDTDGEEEMSVVRTGATGVTLDVYEYDGGKVRFADAITLVLDPMDDDSLMLTDSSLVHVQARLTIFPSGADRFYCLTVELQDAAGEYDAYTVVLEYAKEKLSVKKSYRLRQGVEALTLMGTDHATLLFMQMSGQPTTQSAEESTEPETEAVTEAETEPGTEVSTEADASSAKHDDLQAAFRTEFEKLGLHAPQVTVENGRLKQYKVTPVESEQHLFDVTVDAGKLSVTDNGFLQSFILRR